MSKHTRLQSGFSKALLDSVERVSDEELERRNMINAQAESVKRLRKIRVPNARRPQPSMVWALGVNERALVAKVAPWTTSRMASQLEQDIAAIKLQERKTV